MNIKWSFAVVLLAAWLMPQPLAQAQAQGGRGQRSSLQRPDRRNRPDQGPEMHLQRIREELNLDEQQQAEYDRLAAEFREKRATDTDMKSRRELMDELRQARKAGDDERVAELRDQLEQTRPGAHIDEFLDEVAKILHKDQLEKLEQIRADLASRPGGERGRGPLAQLRSLRSDLKLNEEQGAKYDELYAQLEEQLKPSQSEADKELLKQLAEAAQAGDEQRIKELRAKLPDRRGQNEEAVAAFFDKLEPLLDPEQTQTLEQYRERMQNGPGGPGQTDLRACFRFVSGLDLSDDQRQAVHELQGKARQSEREARRDPGARAQATADVLKELRGLLTDEQVAEFDKWLDGRKAQRPGRGPGTERPRHRNRGGAAPARPGGPTKP